MKKFDYVTAINQLGIEKRDVLNTKYNPEDKKIPSWVQGHDMLRWFIPYLCIIGDSREQDHWIENMCKIFGIQFIRAKKDAKAGTENLKEGDYTFKVVFSNKTYDYTGIVSYERKGSIKEFYNNCQEKRAVIKREFERFGIKHYNKVVLMLQFGEKLTDLIDAKFYFFDRFGQKQIRECHYLLYSTIMSWKQPNNNDFDVIQSNSKETLFWLMIQDMFYYFRQELRLECLSKNLIEEV